MLSDEPGTVKLNITTVMKPIKCGKEAGHLRNTEDDTVPRHNIPSDGDAQIDGEPSDTPP